MSDLVDLSNYLRGFAAAREWEPFHTPANLAKSVSIEANELLECFQWSDTPALEDMELIRNEMADVLIYLLYMADVLGVDLGKAAWRKIAYNEKKYPIEKSRGRTTKYDKL